MDFQKNHTKLFAKYQNKTAGNSGFKKWRGLGFIRNWKGF